MSCVLDVDHGLWHRDESGAKWRDLASGEGPDLGMLLDWSVDPAGRARLVLRCGACDAESRKAGVAFVSWEWREPLVGLVGVASVAEAHRLERHTGEGQ
jgi:hypothetical protein